MPSSLVFHYGKIHCRSKTNIDFNSMKISNISVSEIDRAIDIIPDNYLRSVCFSTGEDIVFSTHIFDVLSNAIYEPLTLLTYLFLWRIDADPNQPNLLSTTKLACEIGARKAQIEGALERLCHLGLITCSDSVIKEFSINKRWIQEAF